MVFLEVQRDHQTSKTSSFKGLGLGQGKLNHGRGGHGSAAPHLQAVRGNKVQTQRRSGLRTRITSSRVRVRMSAASRVFGRTGGRGPADLTQRFLGFLGFCVGGGGGGVKGVFGPFF